MKNGFQDLLSNSSCAATARLKQVLERMAETSSLDDALKAEVVELRAALSEASEAGASTHPLLIST